MNVKTFQVRYGINSYGALAQDVEQQVAVWLRENPKNRIHLMTQTATLDKYGTGFVMTTILYEDKET